MQRLMTLALLLAPLGQTAWAADLEVEITRIAAAEGTITVSLFASAEDWEQRRERKTSVDQSVSATPPSVLVRFEGLEPGRYAVTAYHDRNEDGRFDRLLGIFPGEPYALSNNLKPQSPPAFDALAVEVDADGTSITLNLIAP